MPTVPIILFSQYADVGNGLIAAGLLVDRIVSKADVRNLIEHVRSLPGLALVFAIYAHPMPDQNHQPCYRYRDTLSASAELSLEDGDKAWRLLDDAIALAIKENQWVLTLSHHAAMISTFLGNMELVKHYCNNRYRSLQKIRAR